MSKAITTRYVGATDRRPARILARDEDGNRITHPVEDDGQFPHTNQHHAAAVALCTRMHWPGADTLRGGSIKHGMVWVFAVFEDMRYRNAVHEIAAVLIDGDDWRELQSCADAVMDISTILDDQGFGPTKPEDK